MESVCTCCGKVFNDISLQKIGEELCNECYIEIYIDISMCSDVPLEYSNEVFKVKPFFSFSDLKSNYEESNIKNYD